MNINTEPSTFSFFSRTSWKPLFVLAAGFAAFFFLTGKAYQVRGKYVTETVSEFGQLPSSIIQAASLEFKGVVSDYLLFKTVTYMGLKIAENKSPAAEEWALIHQTLERVTDLDPRFLDPYVFAEMMLAWDAGMIDEANSLLEKAALNLPNDYRPYYYMGFNELYFNKNAEKAAPYLRESAKRPNAPPYIQGLASRFSVYSGELSTGIFFLENLIQDTQDPRTLAYFKKRLSTMKIMFYLEEKAKQYKEEYGELPESLDGLVTSGVIPEIPSDPYGGDFVLLKNGRVYTTSEMVTKTE